jgi:hypothetical protein
MLQSFQALTMGNGLRKTQCFEISFFINDVVQKIINWKYLKLNSWTKRKTSAICQNVYNLLLAQLKHTENE